MALEALQVPTTSPWCVRNGLKKGPHNWSAGLICSSENRDQGIIAIVETVAELWAIERSGIFNGHYHVLGSTLSAATNQNPNTLRLFELLNFLFLFSFIYSYSKGLTIANITTATISTVGTSFIIL